MSQPSHNPRLFTPLLAGGAFLVGVFFFASIGANDARANFAAVLMRLAAAGLPAAAYVIAGIGLGRFFGPLTRESRDPLLLQTGLGVGTLLWLSHLLGTLGLFAGHTGAIIAAIPVAVGCILAAKQLIVLVRTNQLPTPSHLALLIALAAALLLVAACGPPGWLWSSEFGGYDALEYHLQLPQEWLMNGRLASLPHNVYSYFPSFTEAAYLHLGSLTYAPTGPEAPFPGLLADEGWRLISCQLLHAFLAIVAAWSISRAAAAFIPDRSRAPLAFAISLCTPWLIVVGSLAYDESPLLLFTAAAIVAATDETLAPSRTGIIVGVLVVAAVGVKATGLLFTAAPVAVLLAVTLPPRRWPGVAIPAAIACAILPAPWLIRNTTAGGNPLFPFFTGLFGAAHWPPDQVARFLEHHRFEGSWADRFRFLFLPDANDPSGTPQYRGLSHPQWALFFPFAAIGLVASLIARRTHLAAFRLTLVLLVQLLAWLFFTHIQSRFLLPMLVPGACLIALAASRLPDRPLARVALAILPALQLAQATLIFREQHAPFGGPNAMLLLGPGVRTGEAYRDQLAKLPEGEMRRLVADLPPEAFCNLFRPRDSRLYLLGDSTPLYFAPPVVYNTPYDTWPFLSTPSLRDGSLGTPHLRGGSLGTPHLRGGSSSAPLPENPAGITKNLRAQGIDLVLVNLSEVSRLRKWHAIDPAITPDAVRQWLATTRPIKAWEHQGIYLVDIREQTQP